MRGDTMADEPPRDNDETTAAPLPLGSEMRPVAPIGEDEAGGDPVCWAHLVCEECGAVTTDGHRAGCSRLRT